MAAPQKNPAPQGPGAGVSQAQPQTFSASGAQGQAPDEPAKVLEQIKEHIRMSIEKELKLVKGDVIEAQKLSERLIKAVSSAIPFDLTVKKLWGFVGVCFLFFFSVCYSGVGSGNDW